MTPKQTFRAAALFVVYFAVASAFMGCGDPHDRASAAPEPRDAAERPDSLADALGSTQSIMVTDSAGREVEVRLPIERAVVLTNRAAEVLRAIGGADRIVAINSNMKDRDAAFWPKLSRLPAVGSAFEPNVERIAELRPDLVIAYAWRPGSAFNDQMAAFGVPVLRLDCYWPAQIADDIRLLGRLFDADKGAERLVAFLDKWNGEVERRIADVPLEQRPAIYMEGYGEFRGSGPSTASHIMCELAGGRNIVEALKTRNPLVSSEWILEQNPYAVVKAVSASAGGYGAEDVEGMRAMRAEIMARTGWGRLSAVREGRVFLVSSNVWLGPAHVASRAQLAKWFYPDRLEDVDPQGILVEYLREFHGLDDPGAPFYP